MESLFPNNIWAFLDKSTDNEDLLILNFKVTWHLPKHSGAQPGYFWKVTCKEDPDIEFFAKECKFFVFTKTGANHIECKGFVEQDEETGIVTFYEKDMRVFYESIQEQLEASGIVFVEDIH